MHRPFLLAAAAALFVLGCASTSIRTGRDRDDAGEAEWEWQSQSPDAFVERLGEPAEWRRETKGDQLRMIALWKCLDGRDREVTWRHETAGKGVSRWVVVSDTSREADCD